MALRVWLPLNKDLRNQGLLTIPITNNSATFSNGCANVGSSSITFPTTDLQFMEMRPNKTFSVACWVKGVQDGNWLFALSNWEVKFRTTEISVYANNTGGSTITYSVSTTSDQWRHIAITWNGKSENKLRLYVDGVFRGESTFSSSPNNLSSTFYLVHSGDRSMYDFRIYDHALSKKEVTELARGCVLHYPCNDINSQVLNNVFSYPTFNTSNSNGGWSHWGNTGYHAEYSQNTNKDYIYNKSNTYSHYVKCYSDSPVSYICYQSPAFDGGYRSVQAIIKMEDKSVPDTSKINIYFNAGVGSAPPMQYIPLGDDFYLIKREGFQQDGSNDLVDISVTPGNAVYISEAYCENNMQVCSNIFHTGTYQLKDMSGFDNHSTITGSLPLVSIPKPARYSKSMEIQSGAANYTSCTLATAQVYSASLWIWFDSGVPNTTNNNAILFTLNPSKYNVGLNFNQGQYAIVHNGPSQIACKYDLTGKYTSNSWNHFVINNNGSTTELWVNGVKLSSPSSSRFYEQFEFVLGGRTSGDWFYRGKISDFRLFTRTLTQQDVDDLYKDSFAIDKNQNLYCYELVEKSIDDETNLIYNGQMTHGMDGYATLIAENQQTIDMSDKPGGCTASYVCNTDTINPWTGGGRKGIVPVIPYINTDTYKLSYKFKDNGSTRSTKYMCIMPYDNKGKFIDIDETNKYQGNITTLAQDLKNGDTIVYLTSTTNWVADTTYRRLGIIESAAYGDDRALYKQTIAQNGVNTSNNTVTLSSSWNGGTYKAGSKVREFSDGSTYLYPNMWSDNPTTWTYKEKEFAKSWESRLPFSYFLGIGPMYVKGKFADLRFENLSREQKRIPNGTDTIPLFITSEYGNIDSYEETITDIKKSGILDTGMLTTGFLPVRYIRDSINGSTVNAYNFWCEIQAFDRWGRNVAFAADGTWDGLYSNDITNISRGGLNKDNTTSFKPLHNITKGVSNPDTNWYLYKNSGTQSATIDMGIVHYIDSIKVWHYYAYGRTFHNAKTEVSADGVNWTTVFDSTLEGEYAETAEGHTITFDKQGLYNYNVRLRKGGEILTSNEIIEI